MKGFNRFPLDFTIFLITGLVLFGSLSLLQQQLVHAATSTANIASDNTLAALGQFSLWQAIALGIVQGLTEFLPISSTAHLKVVPVLLGWGDPGVTFTAVIQLGSIAAVIYYFWQDLVTLSRGSWQALREKNWQSNPWRISLGIALGTLPIVVCGFGLKIFVPDLDNSGFRSMTTIAIASIAMAILLGLGEKLSQHQRNFEQLRRNDGIFMGCAQALALIPGVSRSGSTITAGLFLGLDRATAARFSFLLGIPAITLAGLVELVDVVQVLGSGAPGGGFQLHQSLVLLLGVISSGIFSYLAIAWLIKFLQKQSTWVFVWYRLVFGILLLIFYR